MASLVSSLRHFPDPSPAPRRVLDKIRRLAGRRRHGLFALGIEVLPYDLVGVIADENEVLLGPIRLGLPDMEESTVVAGIAELAAELVAASPLDVRLSDPRLVLGIEIGGPVDRDNGVVRALVNNPHDYGEGMPPYEWVNTPLAELVQAATGCATFVDNDAQTLAAYEQRYGVGVETSSFTLFLIRNGIGGAVVVNNHLMDLPMEVGHLLGPHKERCDCKMCGCIESRAGRRATPARVAKKTKLKGSSFEWAVDLGNSRGPYADQALEAFKEAGEAIARGIGAVLTLFGSPFVVIYGPEAMVGDGASRVAGAFMGEVRRFPEFTFPSLRNSRLTTRPLTVHGGPQGVALIALNRHFSIPVRSERLEYSR